MACLKASSEWATVSERTSRSAQANPTVRSQASFGDADCAKKKDNGTARWPNWALIEHKAAAAKVRWTNTQRQRLRQTTMSWKSWIAPPTMAATSKNSLHTLRT
jgi:hypothetical protein